MNLQVAAWLTLASFLGVSSVINIKVSQTETDDKLHGFNNVHTGQYRHSSFQQSRNQQQLKIQGYLPNKRQSISGSSGGFSGGGGSSAGSGSTSGSFGSSGGFSGTGGSSASNSNTAIAAGAAVGVGFVAGIGGVIEGDIGQASGGSSSGSSSSSSSGSPSSSNSFNDGNSEPFRLNLDDFDIPEVGPKGVIAAGATVFMVYLLKFMGSSLIEDFKRPVLRDFPDCGRRNETGGGTLDECIWECEWKPNPIYRTIRNREITSVTGTRDVEIYWNLLKIPKDLNCLQPCRAEFYKDVFISDLKEIPGPTECANLNYQTYVDCYIEFKRDLLEEGTFFWRIRNFRDIIIGSCLLASEDPTLFGGQNCDEILPKLRRKKYKKGKNKMHGKKALKVSNSSWDSDRIFGASSEPIINYDILKEGLNIQKYPWLCSLRTRGFRGRHRCGVTLLYGPSVDLVTNCDDVPTILVSAAHCNFVCKSNKGNTLEFCCCRDPDDPGSCRNTSSYCRDDATLQEALPQDLQIVCGEWSIEEVPENYSFENELILDVLNFTNHPNYDPRLGPIGGNDISVYQVDTKPLCDRNGVKQGEIYPACLPRSSYQNNHAILAGWIDPQPAWTYSNNKPFFQYRVDNVWPRQAKMTNTECKDPEWMGSNTFYPAATKCYTDPSGMSCHSFGTSGAPAVRMFQENGVDRYSWVGPLSFYNGCDRAWIFNRQSTGRNDILEAGENPGVFTDGSCYLDWIAHQYGMRAPKDYVKDPSCTTTSGNRTDVDKYRCLTNTGSYCDFTARHPDTNKIIDQCETYSIEGYAKSINTCIDRVSPNQTAICSNNCRGVDPKTIIVGGLPVLASAITGLSVLQTVFGLGAPVAVIGVGAVTVGGYYMCAGPLYCQVGQQCCLIVTVAGRGLRCPSRC